MSLSHTITFPKNGPPRTLYTDKLPLREMLGPLSMQRASSIEFNDTTQEWEVRFLPSSLIPHPSSFSNPSREECLRWEHEQLNK